MDNFNFRTELFPKVSENKISMASKIFSIGSCFADVMGKRLEKNKFKVLSNPFGIIFNPISIQKIFQIVKNQNSNYQNIDINKLIMGDRDGQFFYFDLHSKISAPTKENLESLVVENISLSSAFLSSADFIIITLGTSFVYKHLASGEYVANCHKMPGYLFEKELLDLSKINGALANIIKNAKALSPSCHIILTVSPVRHIKDTIVLNHLSKSLLCVACHEAIINYPGGVSYFPAYEIMMDDLRDYRFYKPDMIHPSEVAENYIWKKFTETYFDNGALSFLKKWEGIEKLLGHKFFKTDNENYFAFVKKTLAELYNVRNLVGVESEIMEWEKKLNDKTI